MGQANYGELLTRLENKGEELVFVAGRRQLGEGCFEQKFTGEEQEFEVWWFLSECKWWLVC